MLFYILAFLLGDLLLQNFSQLPSRAVIILLVLSAIIIAWFIRRRAFYSCLLIAFIFGFI